MYDTVTCDCTFRLEDCVPRDEFVGVMQCDNVHGSRPAECSYTKSVGMYLSEEAREGLSRSSSATDAFRRLETTRHRIGATAAVGAEAEVAGDSGAERGPASVGGGASASFGAEVDINAGFEW